MWPKLIFAAIFYYILSSSVCAQQRTHLKVLTYNVLHGFEQKETKKASFARWVRQKDPDVIAFQELNGFTDRSFKSFAGSYGHRYTVLLRQGVTGIGISSRYPIKNVHKVTEGMYNHGFIQAEIRNYYFFAVYLTPSPLNFTKRIAELNIILSQVKSIKPRKKIILLGDCNAFCLLDSSLYQQTPTDRPEFKGLKGGKPDYQALQSVLDAGFRDAIRLIRDSAIVSFPTSGYREKIPARQSRLDYIWLNKQLARKCIAAEIIKDPVTDTLSDHYPVFIKLRR